MSLIAPRNTLRHQLARPLCVKREMGRVNAQSTAGAMKELVESYKNSMVKPECMAVQFYLLQHAMSNVRTKFGMDEPLGDAASIVELHHERGVELGQRMFTYLLLICTREARHVSGSQTFTKKVESKFGKRFVQFLSEIKGVGSSEAVKWFISHPPEMELGTYAEGLEFVFRKGNFHGGYGGEPWANIAELLHQFVIGVISAEMMLDTAFTLAHNGGPIFNKGIVFKMYDTQRLRMVLDVQASGQIPQMIDSVDDYAECAGMTSIDNRNLLFRCKAALGDDFGGQIDWFAVAKGHLAAQYSYLYSSPKQVQTQKYGVPEWIAGAEAEEAKKKAEAAAANALAQKAKQEEAEKKAAILKAAHFTVGLGAPLKKESRNG